MRRLKIRVERLKNQRAEAIQSPKSYERRQEDFVNDLTGSAQHTLSGDNVGAGGERTHKEDAIVRRSGENYDARGEKDSDSSKIERESSIKYSEGACVNACAGACACAATGDLKETSVKTPLAEVTEDPKNKKERTSKEIEYCDLDYNYEEADENRIDELEQERALMKRLIDCIITNEVINELEVSEHIYINDWSIDKQSDLIEPEKNKYNHTPKKQEIPGLTLSKKQKKKMRQKAKKAMSSKNGSTEISKETELSGQEDDAKEGVIEEESNKIIEVLKIANL